MFKKAKTACDCHNEKVGGHTRDPKVDKSSTLQLQDADAALCARYAEQPGLHMAHNTLLPAVPPLVMELPFSHLPAYAPE
eukprot:3355000-Prymnesium_polylepis.2